MLNVTNLTKVYNSKKILDCVNINIPKGIFCLLGSNGEGKSTLLKILSLNEKYTSGVLTYYEKPLYTMENQIGYLSQDFEGLRNLSVIDNLEYVSLLKGLRYNKEELLNFLRLVNLECKSTKKVKELSCGMVKRLGISIALLGDPLIVLLDEPTAGLDQIEILRIRNIIRKLGRTKVVIFSTHLLSDVETIANTFAILKDGKIKYQANLNKDLSSMDSDFVTNEIVLNHEEIDSFLSKNNVISFKRLNEEDYIIRYIIETKEKSSNSKDSKTIEDYFSFIVSNQV